MIGNGCGDGKAVGDDGSLLGWKWKMIMGGRITVVRGGDGGRTRCDGRGVTASMMTGVRRSWRSDCAAVTSAVVKIAKAMNILYHVLAEHKNNDRGIISYQITAWYWNIMNGLHKLNGKCMVV